MAVVSVVVIVIRPVPSQMKNVADQVLKVYAVLKYVSVWKLYLPETGQGKQMLRKIEPSSRIDRKRTKTHH